MCIECQKKHETKNYVIEIFYRPCPEDKENLNQIQSLDTILSAVIMTWSKTTGSTNIDLNNITV